MRTKGLLPISANFEVKSSEPLDARDRVQYYTDLTSSATWLSTDGQVYTYPGMIVSVYNSAENNGVYILTDSNYTELGNWVRLDSSISIIKYMQPAAPVGAHSTDIWLTGYGEGSEIFIFTGGEWIDFIPNPDTIFIGIYTHGEIYMLRYDDELGYLVMVSFGPDDNMLSSEFVGPTATKSVNNSDKLGGIAAALYATLDAQGLLVNNIQVSKLVGVISTDNLPSYVDDIINVQYWQDTEPVSAENSDYLFNPSTNTFSEWVTDAWVPVSLSESVIYNNISVPGESHSFRWSGESMVSTENPLSFATKDEAEAGNGSSQAMSPLRTLEAFLYHVANNVFTSLNGRTITGAISYLLGKVINTSADVPYHNSSYDTVEKALDKLLYLAPSVTSFTSSVTSVEKGTTVNDVTLSWAFNKTATLQTINQGIGEIPVGTSNISLSLLNITSNITWTIVISDGTSSASKSVTLGFYNKRYWGTSSLAELDDQGILLLSKEFSSNRLQTRSMDASGGKYLWFAMPASYNCTVNSFKVGGLFNSDWIIETIDFTNSSGYTESYNVFRSGNIQSGSSITVEII